MVNVVAVGLKPNTEYDVRFLFAGMESGEATVARSVGFFATNDEGEGSANFRGFRSEVAEFDGYEGITPRFLISKHIGANIWRVMTTSSAVENGPVEDIEPAGSNRGE